MSQLDETNEPEDHLAPPQDEAEEATETTPNSIDGIIMEDGLIRTNTRTDLAIRRLSWPLMLLFGINGITLALPTTAIMYIVNTRVAMPLSIISTYGAIAFLPVSLKPLYAYLSSRQLLGACLRRPSLIALLHLLGAVSTAATAWIPSGGIFTCIAISFLRTLFNAWPEFLQGLTLISEAWAWTTTKSSYNEVAARFQSQAATSRNLGSLVAYMLQLLFVLTTASHSNNSGDDVGGRQLLLLANRPLDDRIVTQILVTAALFDLLGAILACVYSVGSIDMKHVHAPVSTAEDLPSYASCGSANDEEEGQVSETMLDTSSSLSTSSIRFIVLLQCTILVLGLRRPIQAHSATWVWRLIVTTISMGWIGTLGLLLNQEPSRLFWAWIQKPLPKLHRAGLFLILRHAVPNPTYLMGSFFYQLFGTKTPAFLTVLSVWDSVILSWASWSYGRLLSRFHQRHHSMLMLILATTTVGALATLVGNSLLFTNLRCEVKDCTVSLSTQIVIGMLAAKTIMTIAGEWKFMPDVVLATTTAADNVSTPGVQGENDQMGLRYGSLVSCIDFGGQLGALFSTPLVAAFGTSRENNWEHMEGLILTSGLAMLFSSLFLILLWRP